MEVRKRFENDKLIRVGSGFTKQQRAEFLADPSLIIGKVIEVNPLQLKKAPLPIEVIELGILIEFNSLQSLKAPVPIEITLYITSLYDTELGIEITSVYPLLYSL